MNIALLQKTAQAMIAKGKGIMAIDESHSTCKKRFDAYGIECTEENRRAYREILITPDGLEEYISGVILFDETIKQSTTDGIPFTKIMQQKNILPGIKVDLGAKDLALHPEEKITEGLDGLRERLTEYKKLGAMFAKWRAVITIGKNAANEKSADKKSMASEIPTQACIKANAHALARYAAICQEMDIVPMVEPEVLMDGSHTIEQCYEITAKTLQTLFSELIEQGVSLEGTILKTSMIISGKDCPEQAGIEEVAEKTVKCLKENVPQVLAGIVFLSGGQSDEKATLHLDAMNRIAMNQLEKKSGESALPWPLSFSYGRALQAAALKIWAENFANNLPKNNDQENDQKNAAIISAKQTVTHRARMNSLAALGKYEPKLEKV